VKYIVFAWVTELSRRGTRRKRRVVGATPSRVDALAKEMGFLVEPEKFIGIRFVEPEKFIVAVFRKIPYIRPSIFWSKIGLTCSIYLKFPPKGIVLIGKGFAVDYGKELLYLQLGRLTLKPRHVDLDSEIRGDLFVFTGNHVASPKMLLESKNKVEAKPVLTIYNSSGDVEWVIYPSDPTSLLLNVLLNIKLIVEAREK